ISSSDSISSIKSFSLARGVSVLFASFNTSSNVSTSLLIKLGKVFSNPNRIVKPFDAIVCCLFNSFRNPKPNTKLYLSKIMCISPFYKKIKGQRLLSLESKLLNDRCCVLECVLNHFLLLQCQCCITTLWNTVYCHIQCDFDRTFGSS